MSNTALWFFFLCNFPPHFQRGIQLVFTLLVFPSGYTKQSNASWGLDTILHLLHLKTSSIILANSLPLVEKKKGKKKKSSVPATD